MKVKRVNVGRIAGLNSYELAVKLGLFTGTYEEYCNREMEVYNDMVKYYRNARAEIDRIIAGLSMSAEADLSEVIAARGTYDALKARLDASDAEMAIILTRLNAIDPSLMGDNIYQSGNDKNIEIRNNGAYIQWKFVGYTGWNDLVALDELRPHLSIGTVETVEPDQPAKATFSGTQTDPVLNFQIPRGRDGIDGGSIINIYRREEDHHVIAVIKNASDEDITASYEDNEYLIPQITIGNVETLGEDEKAYCYISGSPTNPMLNFGIPKGKSTKLTNGWIGEDGFLNFELT